MAVPDKTRRGFLEKTVHLATGFLSLLLLYPLLRFLHFKVQPKPRHIMVNKPLLPRGYHMEHDFILFMDENKAWAVSRICTHLGCRVGYRAEQRFIECPCHQSRFSNRGKRLSGPAKADLKLLSVEARNDSDGVLTGFLVTL
jgi:cytochrome b6-f complex iron-sulfur subunit